MSKRKATDVNDIVDNWDELDASQKAALVGVSNALISNKVTAAKVKKLCAGRKVKDPNAPKKPLSSYLMYCKDNRDRIKAENPDVSFQDLSRLLGQAWKSADEDVREKYTTDANEALVAWKAENQ